MAGKYLSWPTFSFLAEHKSICPSCLGNCNLFAHEENCFGSLISVCGKKLWRTMSVLLQAPIAALYVLLL